MIQKVIEYLDKRGWSYSKPKSDGSISLSLTNDNGTYYCLIYPKEDTKIFAFISFLGTHCPPEKLERMLILVNEVNDTLLYGNFEINTARDIKHRTSIYLEDTEITEAIIEGVIMRNIFNIDLAKPIFSKVMFGDMRNEEAYGNLFPHLKVDTKELKEDSSSSN